jgi:hypothetical protein
MLFRDHARPKGQRSWQVRILPCNWDNKTGPPLNLSYIEYATLPPKPIDLNSRNAIKLSKLRNVKPSNAAPQQSS